MVLRASLLAQLGHGDGLGGMAEGLAGQVWSHDGEPDKAGSGISKVFHSEERLGAGGSGVVIPFLVQGTSGLMDHKEQVISIAEDVQRKTWMD